MTRPWRAAHTGRARALRRDGTPAERALWLMLRDRGIENAKFRRQAAAGAYIADFLCVEHRLVVELDGGHHADSVAYDARRTAWFRANSYRVLRLWNTDVLPDPSPAAELIAAALRGEA
ncbi:MAG: DUF559 domain-containing protein [Rhodospirillales bacterium]|nr:MAG: DUF559 domain-containing protein [Rhodospirillales bacterium]